MVKLRRPIEVVFSFEESWPRAPRNGERLFRAEYTEDMARGAYDRWTADAPGAEHLRWLTEHVLFETGRPVHVHPSADFWFDPHDGFVTPAEVGVVLHEFCHWLVATDQERKYANHGLRADTDFAQKRELEALTLEWAFIEQTDACEPPGWPWQLFPLVTRSYVSPSTWEARIVGKHMGVVGTLRELWRSE